VGLKIGCGLTICVKNNGSKDRILVLLLIRQTLHQIENAAAEKLNIAVM